jgi:L-aminopeptidase/D-esterase-like protein
VVLCPPGTVAGVAQRGGSPGTRETDLLRPENTVAEVHALLLAGGSAWGLDAAGGVMRWLEAQGRGLAVGPAGVRVPIVPGAVLFDLWGGDTQIRPTAETGWAACEAAVAAEAAHAPALQGCVGAGAGATVGKLYGIERAMAGGVGMASLRHGSCTVAALVAVNALGDVLDEQGQVLAGARRADGRGLQHSTASFLAGQGPARWAAALRPGMATTLGVVGTNAALSKAQATQLAGLAHHGIARAVSPLTAQDGDTVFALATGTQAGPAADLSALGLLAAEVLARAIRNAVIAAAMPG